METETIFRIILPVLLVGFALHRGYYVKKYSAPNSETVKQRDEGLASKLAGLMGMIGFVTLIVFVINPGWLAWSALPFPLAVRWLGVGIAIVGFILLQWAQTTLGKSWSDTPRMIKQQTLVTSGPYHWIRHPIYTAFMLILGSTFLISANALMGLAWLGMTSLEIISRIRFEEALMLEYFGEAYSKYMKHTGRFLPKVG